MFGVEVNLGLTKSRDGLRINSVGTLSKYLPRPMEKQFDSLAVVLAQKTGAALARHPSVFAITSRGSMPAYSLVGTSLVDPRIDIAPRLVGQPWSTSGLSPLQPNEGLQAGRSSSRTTVTETSADIDVPPDNSPGWTHVQYPVQPEVDGWVGVSTAFADTMRQTNSSASSSVTPAQQPSMSFANVWQAQRHELVTPGGRRTLSHEEYHAVVRRVLQARTTMGGVYCAVDRYIELFGIPGAERETMFGTHLAHGLLRLLDQYVFRNRFYGGREYLGWFRCPREFSAANARLPASNTDTQFYPAVFVLWDSYDDEANMACEAILLQGSRPWRVHRSRVWISMSVEEARAQISQLDARAQN